MATPQKISRDGRTLYRVQIRRPTKGIKIDKYFSKKRDAETYIRDVEHAVRTGRPITENVQVRKTFAEAADAYLEDPDAFKTPKGRELKTSAKKDREWRIRWLSRKPDPSAKKPSLHTGGDFGGIVLKNLTWDQIDARLAKLSKSYSWSSATRYR